MTIFENVRVVSFDPATVSGPSNVLVGDDGRIACVTAASAPAFPGSSSAVRGGSGGILTPGLVIGHTHLYSALARGLRVDIAPSRDFCQQLVNLWWLLDRSIDGDIVRSSGAAGAMDAAFCGVTTIIDHHASPECADGSLDILADAVSEVGLRSILCYETTDRNGPEGARAGIAENGRYAKRVDADPRPSGGAPTRAAMIGAHAPFTLGDDTLDALGALVRSSGKPFHAHAAEDRYDAVDSRYRHGLDPLARLDGHGCLVPGSIVAHGLHLTDGDLEILSGRGAILAHCARSNMNNAVGYARFLHALPRFLLGTDGMGADMLEEFRFACFRHRESGGPLWPPAFLASLAENARFAAARFGTPCLEIAPGAPADLAHWDYDPPTPIGGDNLAGHVAFGFSSRSLRSTMVGGRFAVKDRAPAFDGGAMLAESRIQAARLWKRMEERKTRT